MGRNRFGWLSCLDSPVAVDCNRRWENLCQIIDKAQVPKVVESPAGNPVKKSYLSVGKSQQKIAGNHNIHRF